MSLMKQMKINLNLTRATMRKMNNNFKLKKNGGSQGEVKLQNDILIHLFIYF